MEEFFSDRLRAARKIRKWSQATFGKKSGISPFTLAHFESSSRRPSFTNLIKIADTLEISTDYLLGRTNSLLLPADGDPFLLKMAKLPGDDRELIIDFIRMLIRRNKIK